MADTPAQVALDEREETPADEFSRLVIEYNEGEESERDEAWNLIADFACEHADTIVRALSSVYAGDDGQGALVERLRKAADEMREEGQNGWPVTCDDAADRIEALTRENANLRADKERLERERDEARKNAIENGMALCRIRNRAEAAERRGQAQGEAVVELAAQTIYELKPFHGLDNRPDPIPWAEYAQANPGLADGLRQQARAALSYATPPSPEPDAELVRLRDLLFVADRALMEAIGFFPLDRATEKQRVLNDACWLIRQETSDSYEVRRARAETALRRHRKQGGE